MTDLKYDQGKPLAAIPIKDFGRALEAVSEVGTFGAKKYARSSWKGVENASVRYEDALYRHAYKSSYEEHDEESGLLHLAHLAWNALAILQLQIEKEESDYQKSLEPTIALKGLYKEYIDNKNSGKIVDKTQPELDF